MLENSTRDMKTRKRAAPVFKPYVMNQIALMPPSYDEKIPSEHLVRVVNKAIEDLRVDALLKQYAGGGTSSYHPKMMLKILVLFYNIVTLPVREHRAPYPYLTVRC